MHRIYLIIEVDARVSITKPSNVRHLGVSELQEAVAVVVLKLQDVEHGRHVLDFAPLYDLLVEVR